MIDYTVYTDGSCLGNPGPGGAGAYMRKNSATSKNVKRIARGFSNTTNNEMELMAILIVLVQVKEKSTFEIYTDSQYSIDCICKWSIGWEKRGWKKENGPIKNLETIQAILRMCKFHKVVFKKVKGHSDDPLNDEADRLAKEGANRLAFGNPSHCKSYIDKAHKFII